MKNVKNLEKPKKNSKIAENITNYRKSRENTVKKNQKGKNIEKPGKKRLKYRKNAKNVEKSGKKGQKN